MILQAFQIRIGDKIAEGKVIDVIPVDEGLEFIVETAYGYTMVSKGNTDNVEVERV